ncbi:MORN motif, partial [Dillenia turbinata]
MLKKSETHPIGKEEESISFSSDFNSPPVERSSSDIQTQSDLKNAHLLHPNQPQIETLNLPSIPNPSTPTLQINFQNEPISPNPKTTSPIFSIPHKRPLMTQSKFPHYPQNSTLISQSSSSISVPLASKSLVLNLFRRLHQIDHIKFLILSVPSLYFFLTKFPHRSFVIDFLFVLSFSTALVISLKFALSRFSSIRLLLGRTLPIKFSESISSSKPRHPVLWSIGSKQKSEKRPNSGSWVHVFSNGDVYEGELHEGKCSGSGVYYYYMSGRYEGDWVDEKYDGYGVEAWARGSRYRGQYRQGLRHGFGVYRFYTGDVYSGEWSNGQSHGCGIHTCADGSRYVGEFKWGVKHGRGNYHFRNGDRYAGEYFADKMHGFGVYQFGNGHRYEGAWHEGRRQGLGMYTFRNGESQSGHWQNGVLDVPSTQTTQPGSPYAVGHSKVLNAVQEARQAAEKAYDVTKVDERVNRAVAAANRSASAARVTAVKAVQRRMHHNGNNDEPPLPD